MPSQPNTSANANNRPSMSEITAFMESSSFLMLCGRFVREPNPEFRGSRPGDHALIEPHPRGSRKMEEEGYRHAGADR